MDEYIISKYPSVPLRLTGFKYGRCIRGGIKGGKLSEVQYNSIWDGMGKLLRRDCTRTVVKVLWRREGVEGDRR